LTPSALPELISALLGARLPAFPAAHYAKIAKLALWGSNMATFTLHLPEKAMGYPHDGALEKAPINQNIVPDAKDMMVTTDVRNEKS